jgi:hypothetical protein
VSVGEEGRTTGRSGRLFAPHELRLQPTGQALLRELARRGIRPSAQAERRRAESREAMRKLRAWGAELAGSFGLALVSLDPEREGVNAHYGICYGDGTIRIRLRHARTGRLLKESSLVDTLCHELAHLRHMNHGPRFRSLHRRILEAARERGYYRPGPPGPGRPRQGLLFDPGDCGTRGRADVPSRPSRPARPTSSGETTSRS